jgi:hypothetical protein
MVREIFPFLIGPSVFSNVYFLSGHIHMDENLRKICGRINNFAYKFQLPFPLKKMSKNVENGPNCFSF